MSGKIPFFSVVIPLYNKEKFIGRAINSVFSQTIQSFKLIFVDDVSPTTLSPVCIRRSLHEEIVFELRIKYDI